jgi:hypothetical protein
MCFVSKDISVIIVRNCQLSTFDTIAEYVKISIFVKTASKTENQSTTIKTSFSLMEKY